MCNLFIRNTVYILFLLEFFKVQTEFCWQMQLLPCKVSSALMGLQILKQFQATTQKQPHRYGCEALAHRFLGARGGGKEKQVNSFSATAELLLFPQVFF